MLPPLPDKMPSKAEPGKPLYTRKPPQRQRPAADKREMEGERKLHPTRQRPGAGGRGAAIAAIAPPEPRAPRDITLTEGITIRELAEKLDIRAKDLLKTLLDRGVFASINQALDVNTATDLAQSFNGVVSVVSFEGRNGFGSREGRDQRKLEAAAAGGYGYGPRGSRQNQFARCHS
jgi:translation initiation factor IF-2